MQVLPSEISWRPAGSTGAPTASCLGSASGKASEASETAVGAADERDERSWVSESPCLCLSDTSRVKEAAYRRAYSHSREIRLGSCIRSHTKTRSSQ